ncbi:MAG: hypothetical protein P8P74_08375 [Crocinitomicaceae bacterium]|nr:hypothetical protein [Crocinitomicaceae bacterium]
MKKFILFSILLVLTSNVQAQDFSSPKALIETFIKASTKKKKKVLSSCFSNKSPGEWDAIRNKTISKDDLNELKEFVSGATVSKVEMKSEEQAVVFVTFKTREEEIMTVKEGNRWFILDF